MPKWKPSRQVFAFHSRNDDLIGRAPDADDLPVLEDPKWFAEVRRRLCCSRVSWHMSAKWRESPEPVDLVVQRVPDAIMFKPDTVGVTVLHNDLFRVLRPWMKHLLIGSVHVAGEKTDASKHASARVRKAPFVTVIAPPQFQIDTYRRERSFHTQCKSCGLIDSVNWSDEGIVDRTLGDHRVWCDFTSAMLIEGALMDSLGLRRMCPELRFRRIRLLEKPLDGDILPCDPGWDGKFRPQLAKIREHFPHLLK